MRSIFITIQWLSIWDVYKTNRKSLARWCVRLSLAVQLQCVAPDPAGPAGAALGLRVAVTLAQATRTAAGGRETAHLTVLVHSVHYPVDLGISADGL